MLDLVKASVTGAIVTNSLFMLGGAFLLGGLKHHKQEFNPANARTQAGMLLLATIALVVPSAVARVDRVNVASYMLPLSLGLACILLVTYALSLLFSLKTHRDVFASAGGEEHEEEPWPLPVALGALAIATLCIALVSEIFVGSVQQAAVTPRDVEGLRGVHRRVARGRGGRDDRPPSRPPARTGSTSPSASRWAAPRRSPSSWRPSS